MRVPGFARLYAGLLLGRMGGSMTFVALVLFVLGAITRQRWRA